MRHAKIPALQEECGDFLASGPLVCRCSIAEKQRDAPDSGETHQGIDHAADGAAGPAEQEGHDIKAKDADALTAAFNEYSAKQMNRSRKPSVLKQLSRFKELAAGIPAKVRQKKLERDL